MQSIKCDKKQFMKFNSWYQLLHVLAPEFHIQGIYQNKQRPSNNNNNNNNSNNNNNNSNSNNDYYYYYYYYYYYDYY